VVVVVQEGMVDAACVLALVGSFFASARLKELVVDRREKARRVIDRVRSCAGVRVISRGCTANEANL
jgi:hypothetical protein